MDVVLVAPEIPQNTGSIARMCAGTGVGLHLVAPLGFAIDDKHLKRAGLDYWQEVCLGIHPDLESALATMPDRPVWLLTKRARHSYHEVAYQGDEVFVFGPESDGLSQSILQAYPEATLRIPIRDRIRSLNLSASVHVVVYHALAQCGFPGILG